MERQKSMISCGLAREMDIVNYLANIGFTPSKIKGNDYWYHSPFRAERTPSFKVNRKMNRFYDFGEGWGGNLIDFGTRFYSCSISDFLKSLNNDFYLQVPAINSYKIQEEQSNNIQILRVHPIAAPSLFKYLGVRKIPKHIATQFCEEVHYKISNKNYYGIGFKNDHGGYEIRNAYFKGSSSPKAVTTFQMDCRKLSVFEGFFDFMSWLTKFENQSPLQSDFLILNSLSFFEKSFGWMQSYSIVDLYLDNNPAGQNCILKALTVSKCYKDKSGLYKDYEDLNDWLREIPVLNQSHIP